MWSALIVVLLGIVSIEGIGLNVYPRAVHYPPDGPCGDPLYLTPYIESNRTAEGREKARVPSLKGNVESYAGFITVNKKYNSNLFFWFFPSEESPETAPLAVWLQGGPGASSIYAIFVENGPYHMRNDMKLEIKNHYWTQKMNLIYIDNPAGTGFSYTDDDAGYATNEEDVGRDLYSCLVQFLKLFPQYRTNDFYVTGESYAGKYVPACAYAIHKNNPSADLKINLKGIAIGNGLVDPENMVQVYGTYLFEHGLIDDDGLNKFNQLENKIVENIKKKRFYQAFLGFDELINGDLTQYNTLFYNETGFDVYFDYLLTKDDKADSNLSRFLGKHKVRKSIHVGNLKYNSGETVERKLTSDIMNSVKPWFEVLLDNYRVMLYNGQLDIIVAYPLTINFVQKLKWKGANEYKKAKRKKWYVDDQLAGYTRSAKGFTEVLVRNAGHMVPTNQPKWCLDLITKFMDNKL